MEKVRYFDRLKSGKMTRRELNRGLAAAGLGLVTIPGCTPPAPVSVGEVPLVYEWSTYDDPSFYVDYLTKYGDPPRYEIFIDEYGTMAKIRDGADGDIAHPCMEAMQAWVDTGIIAPIDTSRLSNWPDIFPALRTFEGVMLDGQVVMLPLDWGNASVIYRTDLAVEYVGDESWNILFDEKYKGKLAMYDASSAVVVAGLALGYTNIWNMTDEQLVEVRKLLEKQADLVHFYWVDQSQVVAAMASGELVAAYAWNDAVVKLRYEGVPVKYMKPKEGILTWLCGLSLLNTGDGDEQMMYDYLDAWAAPETGRYLISEYAYGHANRKAFDLVDPDELAIRGLDGDMAAMLAGAHIFSPIPDERYETYMRILQSVKRKFGV